MKKILWVVIGIASVFIIWIYAVPLPSSISTPVTHESLRILDRNGKLLYEARKADSGLRHDVLLNEIPSTIIDALIATEDRTFYSHIGISPTGIFRAAWRNLTAGQTLEGGSTITQQLIRNYLQPEQRNLLYKMYEALLAIKLERHRTKNEILTAYLNTAYFGHQAYGIAAAAKIYFDKSVSELSLSEGAILIGLLKSPVRLDPFINPDEAKRRQQTILTILHQNKKISDDEYEEYGQQKIILAPDRTQINAPHFVHYMLGSINEDVLESSEIRTTLDLDLQNEIQSIASHHLEKLREKNVTSAAVVVLDTHTGEILTMLGSIDYFDEDHQGAYNVTTAPRQPGSALKPFTYALAFARGDTAATTIADTEATFLTEEGNPYIPRNYDFGYHGLVRYREALANSYNIPAVKVLEKVGVARLQNFLKAAGITTLNKSPEFYGLALTLGSGEVTLLELTKAFGIFPRGGITLSTTAIRDQKAAAGTTILDPKVAWLITSILSDHDARLPEFGENGPLSFDFPVAAKTGTTRNSRDNWTIGFTPDRLVGVWVGNADNSPMKDTSGVTGAGPIFHDVMLATMRNLPTKDFTKPAGIVKKEICKLSGMLPTERCTERMFEYFIEGTEPTKNDTMYRTFMLDKRNNLLAGPNCNPSETYEKAFVIFPAELVKWSLENGYPLPPAKYSPFCPAAASESGAEKTSSALHITKPHNGDVFKLDPNIPLSSQKIIFEAAADPDTETVDWYIDEKKIATSQKPLFRWEWEPKVGNFQIKAVTGDTESSINIEIY